MNQRRLILASTSPSRKRALSKLGVNYDAVSPAADEDALKIGFNGTHAELALFLAEKKAESVWKPGVVVIAGDQLVSFAGDVYGKPRDFKKTCEQLERFSGKVHHLITATWLTDEQGKSTSSLKVATMTMRTLTRQQIETYVALDRSWDCAGAYRFEGSGALLFDKIETDDSSQIEGMPLLATMDLLNGAGWNLPRF